MQAMVLFFPAAVSGQNPSAWQYRSSALVARISRSSYRGKLEHGGVGTYAKYRYFCIHRWKAEKYKKNG